MDELLNLPNIGPVLAEELTNIGITTYEDLAKMGSVETVLKLGHQDEQVCYNRLYALEGAIQRKRWHTIPNAEKQILKKQFINALKV